MHTFYQRHQSKRRWIKDHPLEQVRRNPSKPLQTRRQLATDPELCMFSLTVSIAKPKNIKEAMADSAWIEAMQDELHQFDKLQVWELVDKPFCKKVIKLKCTNVYLSSSNSKNHLKVFKSQQSSPKLDVHQMNLRVSLLKAFITYQEDAFKPFIDTFAALPLA
ncbi:hypothetical protein Tco_1555604 [Tanacetum coccineum]